MATRKNSTKMLKREKVVPFIGEENFVVPKRGGFGQPDMEGYVMVAGSSTLDLPSPPITSIPETLESGQTTSTIPTPTPPTTPTSPTEPPTTSLPPMSPTTVTGLPQTTLEPPVLTGTQTTTTTTTTPPIRTQTLPPLTADDMPAPVSNIPTFPSVTNMTCDQLKAHILDLETTMATSRFAANVVDAYNTQLALAKSTYTTKCPLPSTQVNVSVTPPVTPPIGGGIFGGGGFGGGGGIGEPPADEVPVEEEQKKGINGLWLILGIGAVVYFLTRRSN